MNGAPKERDLLLLKHELLENQLETEYNNTRRRFFCVGHNHDM